TAVPAHGTRHLGGNRSRIDEAFWLPSFLSWPRTWWALHPGGPVLSFLEGERMGFPHTIYRTGGRDQRQHAISRGRISRLSAQSTQEIIERSAGADSWHGLQEGY